MAKQVNHSDAPNGRKPRRKPAPQPQNGAAIAFDPHNANRHTSESLQAVQLSVARLGAGRSIVVDAANTVVAGEATLKGAQQLGMPTRTIETDGSELIVVKRTDLKPGDPRRVALGLADNKTAKLSDFDDTALVEQLRSLGDNQDLLTATGFSDQELMDLMNPDGAKGGAGDDQTYTNKIVAPVYEPKGERPPLSALIDRGKTQELLAGIEASELPADVKEFLRLAAERHTVFNFRQIAEFYCHADAKLQDLMERSGLVIIDFRKAIEYGFVHLTERLGELADLEEFTDADA